MGSVSRFGEKPGRATGAYPALELLVDEPDSAIKGEAKVYALGVKTGELATSEKARADRTFG
jgi:hypothetical protein